MIPGMRWGGWLKGGIVENKAALLREGGKEGSKLRTYKLMDAISE